MGSNGFWKKVYGWGGGSGYAALLAHAGGALYCTELVLVLVLHFCTVTVSSTGAKNLLQGDDNCHVGRPCDLGLRSEVSLAPPYLELFVSYGASAVTRTSGRGHVAEAKTNVIEVGGFSIRA